MKTCGCRARRTPFWSIWATGGDILDGWIWWTRCRCRGGRGADQVNPRSDRLDRCLETITTQEYYFVCTLKTYVFLTSYLIRNVHWLLQLSVKGPFDKTIYWCCVPCWSLSSASMFTDMMAWGAWRLGTYTTPNAKTWHFFDFDEWRASSPGPTRLDLIRSPWWEQRSQKNNTT